MTDQIADLPLFQLNRLRTELSMAVAELTGAIFSDKPKLGTEFGIVARVCLHDWVEDGRLVRPAAPERAIPVRKIALSLGIPPETVRRNVKLLEQRGMLAVSARGILLAPTAENEALVRHYYLGIHDRFIRMIEDAVATCDLDLPVGECPSFGIGDVIERALDILLLPIDTHRPKTGTSIGFMLWGAFNAAAVREVTYDRRLSRRYANSRPPDAIRGAVSLRQVTRTLSVPYATAWRQLEPMEQAGLITRMSGNRWTVLIANYGPDGMRDITIPPTILMLGKIRALAMLGLDPARAGEYYVLGRPPLADFDL